MSNYDLCPPLEEVARSGGGVLGLILLQTSVYFSISKFIHPPPTGTPSEGRQNIKYRRLQGRPYGKTLWRGKPSATRKKSPAECGA